MSGPHLSQQTSTHIVRASDYGIEGNGTEQHAKLQALMDRVGSTGSGSNVGGIVVLPKGVILTNSQLIIPPKTTLRGANRSATVLRAGPAYPNDTYLVSLGDDSGDYAFGTRIEDLTLDLQAKTGSGGIKSKKVQEQSGVCRVVVGGYMYRGITLEGGGAGNSVEHFTIEDVEVSPHSTATNPMGVRLVTCGACRINRCTVNHGGTKSTNPGFYFNDTRIICTDLHVQKFADGVLIFNNSGGSIIGVGAIDCTNIVTYQGASPQPIFLANIGVINVSTTRTIKDDVAGIGMTGYVAMYTSGPIAHAALPTSSSGLVAGQLWNDGGTVKVV